MRGVSSMARSVLLSAPIIMMGLAVQARAAVITYPLEFEFSGATPPAGAAPWVTATFDDGGTPGSVSLHLETTNLSPGEFVSVWMFNLDPALDPDALSFAQTAKTGSFTDPVITTGVDAFQADGDGLFDIRFAFTSAGGGGSTTRFTAGDSVTYLITGFPTLAASSFDFQSTPAGGRGTFPTAAHVQGTGDDGEESGWVSVPEPTTALFMAFAALPVLARRRRV